MKLFFQILISLIFISSCAENTKEKSKKKKEITATETTSVQSDSITIPSFEIKLELSEKAEKKLAELKESVIVQAYFSGIPKDTTSEEYSKTGMQSIGSKSVELFKPSVAKFENVKISKKNFDGLADKNFEVLINVFSGRRVEENNLLSCDILQKEIDSVKGKQHILKGKLIEEE